ncbi:MAG: class I SAM-dependent methyltransferase [Myxococcales bacterium]|nr:class I SAM-dependent methyltransferase [Myxococcales bacterium]MCB9712686.1 class I SAM-dependent methyltransferase [Myxococcales bacterium]
MTEIDVWDELAEWWDGVMGDGDAFHSTLLFEPQLRFLELESHEHVLDLACGQGAFARQMSQRGARVLGVDGSPRMIELARRRCESLRTPPSFRTLDLTIPGSVATLEEAPFDAAVCSMALQDIAQIDTLLRELPEVLVPGGTFVFSVPHPVFNSLCSAPGMEYEMRDGHLQELRYVRVFDYLRPASGPLMAKEGSDLLPIYHHRPLEVLFGACFRAGLRLVDLVEPAYPRGMESSRALSWKAFPLIPPALVTKWVVGEG